MKRLIKAAGFRLMSRVAPTMAASIAELPGMRQEIQRLSRALNQAERRVTALEDEVQEARRLGRRVAEITDVVEEVLLPAANRDDERLRDAVRKYAKTL